MKRSRLLRIAALSIVTLAGAIHQLPGQATPDSVSVAIERSLHDTNVVSPITGVTVPTEAVRVALATITTSSPAGRSQMSRVLVTSGAGADVVDQLIASLPELGAQPNAAHVQLTLMAFNQLVNMASPRFLVDPPAEFLALHAILVRASNVVHN